MSQARALMIQGTASHVGKSLLTAAFCRILSDQGVRVAPFKAQNMALNSFVTADGAEVSRAQALQAEAARLPLQVEMNPVLLKPSSDTGAQVIVMGRVIGTMAAKEFQAYKTQLWPLVEAAYRRLATQVDVIVIEGAGSPAEINLMPYDIVNMRVAELANAAVLLVGDIDRGGVFASLLGTMEWLGPKDRRRIRGFLINKFRGDRTLLDPGLDALVKRTGTPVLGVVPYIPDLRLEEEDSVALEEWRPAELREGSDRLVIGVLRFPRLSNFTDLDPLMAESDLSVRYVTEPHELEDCRVVVLPGSKNTIEDLDWLRRQRLDGAIRQIYARGGSVIGICGGYQMLGVTIDDPHGVETARGRAEGLSLLAIDTVLERIKRTERVIGEPVDAWVCSRHAKELSALSGYEIHMGRTDIEKPVPVFAHFEDGGNDGAMLPGVIGTYLHGALENPDVCAELFGVPPPAVQAKSANYERLADWFDCHGRNLSQLGLTEVGR